MTTRPGPRRLRPPAIAKLVVVIAIVASGCGGEAAQEQAEGIDVERSGQATMASVRFTDVADEVGLDFRHGAFQWGTSGDPAAMMGGGLCWIDYDDDGWLDLFVVNTWSDGEFNRWSDAGGPPTSRLFANDAGRFTDVTDETGAGLAIRGNGCVAADLDGDGWTDLYVTTDRENALLWNEGGESFVEGATEAGVDSYGWHAGAAVGDLDGDGRLDLVVAGYGDANRPIAGANLGFPNTIEPEPDLVLINTGPDGDGRPVFRDVGSSVGIEGTGTEYGLGVVMVDADLDGDLDVFVANDTNPNRLYLNERSSGGFELVDRSVEAGVDDENAGMGVAPGDYDGDRRPDLAITNMGDQLHNVLRSDAGEVRFDDVGPGIGPAGLGAGLTGWGTAFVDIDLDTDLDLVIAHGAIPVTDLVADREPIRVYENRAAQGEPGGFADVSAEIGLDEVGPFLGRGMAAADYDNDGDLDLAVASIGGELALLRNSGAQGHWLVVAPEPATPGTVVTVTLADGTETRRVVVAGSSYLSSEDDRLHVGLGAATEAIEVRVEWPDGSVVELTDVAADQILPVEPG